LSIAVRIFDNLHDLLVKLLLEYVLRERADHAVATHEGVGVLLTEDGTPSRCVRQPDGHARDQDIAEMKPESTNSLHQCKSGGHYLCPGRVHAAGLINFARDPRHATCW